ncbi:MAG: L-seryl-tRNA(Sec) selenium transferase [Desulfocapsaceae bacterium]|nr:L-seryl-tRNA(Sec) selenium transferase [Desulfocapsaceae bacterium]
MEKKNALLKLLPKVDEAMAMLEAEIAEKIPKALLKKIIRQCIGEQRQAILDSPESCSELSNSQWLQLFSERIKEAARDNLRRVINGTGVVIHTNLGRSLLSEESTRQLLQCSKHYTNLEFDLASGKRGSRYSLVEEMLCDVTGAEAGLVVNNNAAAVLLVIDTLASGKEAIVSRGELVEIGGSFRIPDVMAKSGATLVEVGATNRTHFEDYERAITENTALMMKVHTSNFRMLGFTKEVATEELVTLSQEYAIPVMEDLGSGCFLDLSPFGLPRERTVQEVVEAGTDVVTFSGDKLLGGPQCGLIVGKKEVIDQIKKNPLNRALRIDKFTLASLESVLRNYYSIEDALQNIPTLAMLIIRPEDIRKKANRILRKVRRHDIGENQVHIQETVSQTGGGAIPEYGLASWAVQITPAHVSVNRFERDMRSRNIPIIGRIENEHFILDCRTLLDEDIDHVSAAIIHYFRS